MLQRIRNRKGFTLVELMIVVAIIGILAAIAIPNFLQFRLKAKTSEAKSNLGAIRSTEVAYFAEWNFYVGNQAPTPIANRAACATKVALGPPPPGSPSSASLPRERVLLRTTCATTFATAHSTTGLTMTAVGDLDGDSRPLPPSTSPTPPTRSSSRAPRSRSRPDSHRRGCR